MTDSAAHDQAHDHADIGPQRGTGESVLIERHPLEAQRSGRFAAWLVSERFRWRRSLGWGRLHGRRRVFRRLDVQAAIAVAELFTSHPRIGPVILFAPLTQTLPAMMFTATEWTKKILTTGVTRMSQEANSAVAAMCDAEGQMRMRLDNRVQHHLILPNNPNGWFSLVPVGQKPECFSDC